MPRTRNRVTFTVDGPGVVVATDNGDETNMGDFRASACPVFNGWVQAIVRAKPGVVGTLRVKATAEGCPEASVSISVRRVSGKN